MAAPPSLTFLPHQRADRVGRRVVTIGPPVGVPFKLLSEGEGRPWDIFLQSQTPSTTALALCSS